MSRPYEEACDYVERIEAENARFERFKEWSILLAMKQWGMTREQAEASIAETMARFDADDAKTHPQ